MEQTWLSLIMRQAEKEGDSQAIEANRITLVAFFYSVSGNNSTYSPT